MNGTDPKRRDGWLQRLVELSRFAAGKAGRLAVDEHGCFCEPRSLTRGHPWLTMKLNYPSIAQFQQFVELKDYRPPTKKEYVRNVCKLAEHFQCDPATLSGNQLPH